MNSKETAYAKIGVFSAKNWDTYQILLRKCLYHADKKYNKSSIQQMLSAILCLVIICIFQVAGQADAMTRTLQKQPAIVITAFGTTTKARATYDFFEHQLKKELPEEFQEYAIFWAFTSEIVRERVNKKFNDLGSSSRYYSLAQTLANLEDAGYRKIAIQPLHIFPGQEYREIEIVIQAFKQIGLEIKYGGTLLHEWSYLFETIGALEKEFLPSAEGCNILVTHGTPETFSTSNSTYLGLERYVLNEYDNVFVGSIDGVIPRDQALRLAKTYPFKRVRFIPFMYVAGDHIMNDIMGQEPDKDGTLSWAMELQKTGKQTESVLTTLTENTLYKGLGFSPSINKIFIRQLVENLFDLQ